MVAQLSRRCVGYGAYLSSPRSSVREEMHCARCDRDLQDAQVLVDRAATSLQTRVPVSMCVFADVSMGTHGSAVVSACAHILALPGPAQTLRYERRFLGQ